ncbi:hypothetical protein [Streptomyces murinus]|uniref:hypothetical protein n=1 Tax=Streptomyces murinus TaxID=33900 RepID=UPI003800812A
MARGGLDELDPGPVHGLGEGCHGHPGAGERQRPQDQFATGAQLGEMPLPEGRADPLGRHRDEALRAVPRGITAEHVFPVELLAVVDPAGEPSLGELLGCPAVILFAERGAAVSPGFAVTAENATTVARLVHRLDGLPFAIEPAAARLRTLTPEEILDRLIDRFALLGFSSRSQLAVWAQRKREEDAP